MVNCPGCGGEIAHTAESTGRCPRCGLGLAAAWATAETVLGSPAAGEGGAVDLLAETVIGVVSAGPAQEARATIRIPLSEAGANEKTLMVPAEAAQPESLAGGIQAKTRHIHAAVGEGGFRPVGDAANSLPDFEMVTPLGEGGMGVVFLARQASLNRLVAVKQTHAGLTREVKHRFLAEAAVTAELEHPNIVPVHEAGLAETGEPFYAMKRVTGRAWSATLRTTPLGANLETLLKVADAIAYAHAHGVIHRDLKPENVMIGPFGEVLVMDWGLAAGIPALGGKGARNAPILGNRGVSGTPAYMPPEMAAADYAAIGPASDIYLLGAILFEILTGTPPHPGDGVKECIQNAAANVILPVRGDHELLGVARKALATDPEARHRDVPAFQAELRAYQEHAASLELVARAERQLLSAEQGRAYEDFAQALYRFQEARALWSANARARAGESAARLAYAREAVRRGDLDLAVSLLLPEDPGHQEEREIVERMRLERAERELRMRRRRILMVTRLALAALFMGYLAVDWFRYWRAERRAERVVLQGAEEGCLRAGARRR